MSSLYEFVKGCWWRSVLVSSEESNIHSAYARIFMQTEMYIAKQDDFQASTN
jgi:hypothetical protein